MGYIEQTGLQLSIGMIDNSKELVWDSDSEDVDDGC